MSTPIAARPLSVLVVDDLVDAVLPVSPSATGRGDVSATSVRRMLVHLKYSLQSNRKTPEGRQHPDRDGQFRHISARVEARKQRGEPASRYKKDCAAWQGRPLAT